MNKKIPAARLLSSNYLSTAKQSQPWQPYLPPYHPHSGGIITPTNAARHDRADNIIKVRDR